MKKLFLFLFLAAVAFAQPVSPLSNVRFRGTNNSVDAGATLAPGSGTITANDYSGSAITVSGLTAGRVVFAGPAGLLTDSTGLLYNSGTGALTVNSVTATSGQNLTLASGGSSTLLKLDASAASTPIVGNFNASYSAANLTGSGVVVLGKDDGTLNGIEVRAYGGGSPGFLGVGSNGGLGTALSATTSGQALVRVFGIGRGTTGYPGSARSFFGIISAENFSDTAGGTYITFQPTPNGTTTRAEAARISPTALTVFPTTPSTSATTGSGIFGGGIGVAGAINTGGLIASIGETVTAVDAKFTATDGTSSAILQANGGNIRTAYVNASANGQRFDAGSYVEGVTPFFAVRSIDAGSTSIFKVSSLGAGTFLAGVSATTGTFSGSITSSGDIETNDVGEGFIVKSPNGTRWRITVSNAGAFVATSL